MFTVDQDLLDKAHDSLIKRDNIYWIIGSSCSGKSTISQAIAEKSNISLYDMDTHVYGSYTSLYDIERHPANKTWLSAPNPLAWQLALSLEDFDAFNRAASVEHFDLFSDDIEANYPEQALLVDGGITHPSLLLKIVPRENIFCIDTSRADRVNEWENSEARAPMKQWVFDLPKPQAKWKKFLACDEAIKQTIVTECQANNIELFERDEHTSVKTLAQKVADYFGIDLESFS